MDNFRRSRGTEERQHREDGIPALEAMAVGRPVLIQLPLHSLERFGIDSLPVVSARSKDEIDGALVQLAEGRVRAEEINFAAREWVIRYHRWEVVTERYLALYTELVEANAVAASAAAR
mgnify:CR=1 FL=1